MPTAVTPFCFLKDYPSLQIALGDLGISRQQSKKYFAQEGASALLKRPIKAQQEISLPLNLLHLGGINPDYQGLPLEIVAEDEYFLALHKPAGIHGHPLTYQEQDNCLSFLRAIGRGKLLQVQQDKAERGLLYRLDQATSGILLYAKSDAIYTAAAKAKKIKIYHALVAGDFPSALAKAWRQYFVATGAKGKKMQAYPTAVSHKDGQWGELSIKKLGYDAPEDQSLLEISLKTGLRHQIRAGLTALGFPIVGDSLYGGRMASRLYLHASCYGVELPLQDGKTTFLTYEVPPPFGHANLPLNLEKIH